MVPDFGEKLSSRFIHSGVLTVDLRGRFSEAHTEAYQLFTCITSSVKRAKASFNNISFDLLLRLGGACLSVCESGSRSEAQTISFLKHLNHSRFSVSK